MLNDSAGERIGLWNHALTAFQKDPFSWPFGATPCGALERYNHPDHPEDHFHNGYLGVLLGYGLAGTVLMAAFLVLLLIHSLRLIFIRNGLTESARYLPAVPAGILAFNMTEEMLITRDLIVEPAVLLFLTAGFVFVLSKELKKNGSAAL